MYLVIFFMYNYDSNLAAHCNYMQFNLNKYSQYSAKWFGITRYIFFTRN